MAMSFAACSSTKKTESKAESSEASQVIETTAAQTEAETAAEVEEKSDVLIDSGKLKNISDSFNYGDMVIVDDNTGFKLDAVKLAGDSHNYGVKELAYSTTLSGLEYEFYLDEWIGFYFRTSFDLSKNSGKLHIIALPHQNLSSYGKVSYNELVTEANQKGFLITVDGVLSNAEDEGCVGMGKINSSLPTGDYDFLILNDETICYYYVAKITVGK